MKWKKIKDFEEFYEVSNEGDIRRIGADCYRKPQLTQKGYHKTILYSKNEKKQMFNHRIVAIAFIENPHKKKCVNHKNGIKTDNRVKNLEWCTVKENNQHALENGLYKPKRGSEHGMSKLSEKDALAIRNKSKKKTYVEIAGEYGVSPSTIRRLVIEET